MNDLIKCIYLIRLGKFGEIAGKLSEPLTQNRCLTDALRFSLKYRYRDESKKDSQRTNKDS